MPHLLMINAGRTGLMTAVALLDMGYDLSFVESEQFKGYEDNEVNAQARKRLRHIHTIESTDDKDALYRIARDIDRKNKLSGIFCVLENTMESAAYVAEKMALPFPSLASVKACRNKDRARKLLDLNGIRNARYCRIVSLNELLAAGQSIGYPQVIKPLTSRNSVGTAVLRSTEEAVLAWHAIHEEIAGSSAAMQEQYLRGFIVEEYLSGRMVSAEVAHNGKETTVFMFSGRERSRAREITEYRIDMPADMTDSECIDCETYVFEVVRALKLENGIFHLEVMLTDEGPVLVEANPRVMGSYMPYLYMALTGNPLTKWLAEIAEGGRPEIVPFRHSAKVASAIRFDAAAAAHFNPADFRRLVDEHFECIYSEMPQGEELINVCAGKTIGRIQIMADSHELINERLTNFFKATEKELDLELLS